MSFPCKQGILILVLSNPIEKNSNGAKCEWYEFSTQFFRILTFSRNNSWFLASLDLTQARVNSLQTTCILSLIPHTQVKVHFKVAQARCFLKSWLAWLWRQTVQLFITACFECLPVIYLKLRICGLVAHVKCYQRRESVLAFKNEQIWKTRRRM